jgi:hydrogenase maturation factor
VFAVADRDRYITPADAKPGDEIILTKGPAIETAGIIAVLREKELLGEYPQSLVDKAKALCGQMTVVDDALAAMEVGGVTAMHDATEGGVIGGLFEIANASSIGMEINENLFIYPQEVKMVCDAFNIDPVAAIAEGSLLITADPAYSQKIIDKLDSIGIQASIIGRAIEDKTVRTMKRCSGETAELRIPHQDPFWPVFFKSLQ